MILKTEDIKLLPETFRQLRDLIYEKSGIHFPDNKAYLLECRLGQRVKEKGCNSFEDYVCMLRHDSSGGNELTTVFNAVTINETTFFRDMEQLDVVLNSVLPEMIEEKKRRNERRLRLWSAASSSGEEPYTMAMYLLEREVSLAGWEIEIVGSDISESVLTAARRGVYGSYAIKTTPRRFLNKYFSSNGDGTHSVRPEVKQLVRFANINLYDGQRMSTMKGMDIILCRNVLIYFDDNSKRKVISRLYDCLNPDGYLVIGRSETLHNLTRAFRPVSRDKMILYRKI